MKGVRLFVLTALMICLASDAALSQMRTARPRQRAPRQFVGVSGGATLSDLFGGAINTSSRWGGTAGVFAGYRTTRNSVVALEVNWIQKGGGDTRVDYVEVPLLLGGAAPAAHGAVRFRAYTGIALGFRVGCSSTSTFLSCDAAKSPEWAWPFGFMIASTNRSGRMVGVDVRYSIGLSDVFETSSASNRTWQFKAFFGFPYR